MPRTDMERRRSQVAAVALMQLKVFRALQVAYHPDHNSSSALFSALMCAMAICINDARRRKPVSIQRISKVTGLPRNTVNRHLKPLVELGIIKRTTGGGYAGRDEYLQRRLSSRSFRRVLLAIKACAAMLDKLDNNAY